jgi:hypothetical protein
MGQPPLFDHLVGVPGPIPANPSRVGCLDVDNQLELKIKPSRWRTARKADSNGEAAIAGSHRAPVPQVTAQSAGLCYCSITGRNQAGWLGPG